MPLTVDFFADTDTQEAAYAYRKLGGEIGRGFRAASLLRALEALAEQAPSPLLGFVYGAGFEDRPELLRRIARRWPLLGSDAGAVERLKAPERFFATLDRLGVLHPVTLMRRPANGSGWLAKKIGGAGGSHIASARAAKSNSCLYYQELVAGRAVSALFVGNGKDARVLGFSEQWTAPSRKSPWRYGGAARPAAVPAKTGRQMTAAVRAAARCFKVKGLASADFLVEGDKALLLEINPRPGATLDLFDCGAAPLLKLHLEAIREGKLPLRAPKFADAMASAIVYAECGGAIPEDMAWPVWAADRPKPSEWIDKDRPICTVWARSGTMARAKRLIKERICRIKAGLRSVSRGNDGEQKRRHRRRAPIAPAERERQSGAARQSAHR